MINDRTIARIVGVLFLTTTFAGMIDSLVAIPLLTAPVTAIFAHKNPVMLGVFLLLFMSLGVACIAQFLYPVLKRHSELIASAYRIFRIVECVLLIVGAVVSIFILALSRQSTQAEIVTVPIFQSMATLAFGIRMSCYQIAMVILGLNSMVLCALFFKTGLLPRWISAIGFLGYLLLFASAALDLFGFIDTTGAGGLLYIPGGVFEVVLLPAWLIVKGFNQARANG